jgi:S-adenosylmethionine hydrolase
VLFAHAVYVDRFGNIQLDVEHGDLAGTGLRLGRGVELDVAGAPGYGGVYGHTFADVATGELLVYEDSYRRLAVAVNHGKAAERLGISVGDEIRIRPA